MRYESYCRNPTPEKWRACSDAHRHAFAMLDAEVSTAIDPLIAEQIDAGNAAADKCGRILDNATRIQLERERQLGSAIGFDDAELEGYGWAARRALRKRWPGVSPTDTAEIRSALTALRSRVGQAFEASTNEGKRRKKAHRADATEYLRMQIWMIGSIIVNADHRNLFHVSYATSAGMARVRPRPRRALVTPTCDRPVDGDFGQAVAA